MSAEGGLTAALTLLARDRQYPSICFQIPLYPMIDDRNNTPSTNEIKDGSTPFGKSLHWGFASFITDFAINFSI